MSLLMKLFRLNQLMILHIHKELTDNLKMKEIANEFISMNDIFLENSFSLSHQFLYSMYCLS